MAIEGLVRKAIEGELPGLGARSAIHALELEDYDRLFSERTIHSGIRDELSCGPLYRQILGSTFDRLPEKVRELHDSSEVRRWKGSAKVERGKGPFAAIVASVFGFPKRAEAVPVQVDFHPDSSGELWTRTFGGKSFSSHQSLGTGRNSQLIVERFGGIKVALAAVIETDRLMLIPRRWSAFGIPLWNFLLPKGNIFETERDGQFNFDVELALPLFGLIVSYKGALNVE